MKTNSSISSMLKTNSSYSYTDFSFNCPTASTSSPFTYFEDAGVLEYLHIYLSMSDVLSSDAVGSWNEKSVYKYELFVFNIDEIELFVFIGVENEQFVFNGIENAHLLYPLNSPFRINIWGGGGMSITGFIANEDFGPPPIGSILQKIGKNQNRLRMAWNGEKSKKKNLPLGDPPQKKNFLKIF